MSYDGLDNSLTNFKEKVAVWKNTFDHQQPKVFLKDPAVNELAIRRGDCHPRISEGSSEGDNSTAENISGPGDGTQYEVEPCFDYDDEPVDEPTPCATARTKEVPN